MVKYDVRSVTFQYADAYTPCGPNYGENDDFPISHCARLQVVGSLPCWITNTNGQAGQAEISPGISILREPALPMVKWPMKI